MTQDHAVTATGRVKPVPHTPLQWRQGARRTAWLVSVIVVQGGTAIADPVPAPSTPAQTLTPDPAPLVPRFSALQFVGISPPPPPPSLRIEAARVAAERFAQSWNYPEPGDLISVDGGLWSFGAYHYRPRTTRSAALHGGSIAATIVGEILMAADSPLAGVGALLTGATLDAASADVDRDAEAKKR